MDKVHCTDMGVQRCSGPPASWWFESPWLTYADRWSYKPDFLIYDLDPTIKISPSTSKVFSFRFGRPYISNTDNCTRKGQFRIKNFGTSPGSGFYITVKSQRWNGSQWQDDAGSLVSRTWYSFASSSSELTLPQFSFSVGFRDSITITLSIENTGSSEFRARTVLDDWETGLMFSHGGEVKLFVDGLGNSSFKSFWSVEKQNCLRFLKNGSWASSINEDRTVARNSRIGPACPLTHPDSGYIGNTGNLVFRNESGKALMVVSNGDICCYTTNINKYLGSLY